MSRGGRGLATLLRVRRRERDARMREEQLAVRARQQAEAGVAARERAARGAADDLGGDAVRSGGLWQTAALGVSALWSAAAREHRRLAAAQDAERGARALRVEAERAVAGLERLEARRAEAAMAVRRRLEQRRIDECTRPPGRARTGREVLVALLAAATLLLVAGLPAPLAAESAAAERLSSASLERLLSDIRTRRIELERRESELDERERSVRELERAVGARIEELENLARTVEQRLADWEASHAAKSISKLAKIYSAMPPREAAPLVEALELELATQVLAKMKPKSSAALLPLLSDPRALAISRRVGHPLGVAPAPAAQESR